MRVADGLLFDFDSATPAAKSPEPGAQIEHTRVAPSDLSDVNARTTNKQPAITSVAASHAAIATSNSVAIKPSVETASAQIDVRLVTNGEFQCFLESAGGNPPSTWPRGRCPREKTAQPVTGINWHQAAAYAEWVGKRLPTAAEWDRAASTLERPGALWEWMSDEVKPRGLGRKGTKRALKGGPPTSAEQTQTSAWPDEELDYIGFRCAQGGINAVSAMQ